MNAKDKQLSGKLSPDMTISTILPYALTIADGITKTKNGDYLATIEIDGLPMEGISAAEKKTRSAQIHRLLLQSRSGKMGYYFHRVSKRYSDWLTSPAEGIQRVFVDLYQEDINQSMYTTKMYITFCFRPQPIKVGGWLNQNKIDLKGLRNQEAEAVQVLSDLTETAVRTLAEYGAQRLGHYDLNGILYDSQLEFFNYLLNLENTRIKASRLTRWDRYLPQHRFFYHNRVCEVVKLNGEKIFSSFLDIQDHEAESEPGHLDCVLAIQGEFIETQSFIPYKDGGTHELQKIRGQLTSTQGAGFSLVTQLNYALDHVGAGQLLFGEAHFSLQILQKGTPGEDKVSLAKLSERVQDAANGLQQFDCRPVIVDGHVASAWVGQFPANWKHRLRVIKITSENIADFNTLHNWNSGKRNGNPWGEAVALFPTPTGRPYHFNFHAGNLHENREGEPDSGHTLVFGTSGSGKTVFLGYLIWCMLKYASVPRKTHIVCFDKDRGLYPMVLASGGKYFSILSGVNTGFQPWQLEPTPENLAFLFELVKFGCCDGYQFSSDDEKDLSLAIKAVMAQPLAQRNFYTFGQGLQNEGLRARVSKWTRRRNANDDISGEFGWALDADVDQLQFDDAHIYGFDYTQLLKSKEVCHVVLMYLMHRVNQLYDGRKIISLIDEFAKALEHPYFAEYAKNMQKTARKLHGASIYITQSVGDVLSSSISAALIEQSVTIILLPNPNANRDELIKGLKLSESECDLYLSLDAHSRVIMVKQNGICALIKFDLNSQKYKPYLKLLSATSTRVVELDAIIQEVGAAPENWLPRYCGLDTKFSLSHNQELL